MTVRARVVGVNGLNEDGPLNQVVGMLVRFCFRMDGQLTDVVHNTPKSVSFPAPVNFNASLMPRQTTSKSYSSLKSPLIQGQRS